MNQSDFIKTTRKPFYAFLYFFIAALALFFLMPNHTVFARSEKAVMGSGTSFSGNGVGQIPDGSGNCGVPSPSNLDIIFQVSGVSNIADVSVDMTATHSWVGDITATLIAPTGETHILFRNTGWFSETDPCGSGSTLDGFYNFNDTATGVNWWTAADTNIAIPSGNYRTTESGSETQINPAPETSMNPVFTGISDPTGSWVLRVNDSAGADTGMVSAANLTFNSNTSVPISNGNPDFDGDGKTDFGTVRDETPANLHGKRTKLNRRSIKELQEAPGLKFQQRK